jgi:RNA-directed DNA polymerase
MSISAWNDIDWPLVNSRVDRLQKRIYKASRTGNREVLRTLQKRMLRSFDAKCLSVRRVTQINKGRNTAGVDGVKGLSPDERLSLAQDLIISNRAEPIRRVWIPKPGKTEKRPLGIPTLKDRAAQQLVKLALEPEWEAKFEANSYGFRPGRSCQDAIQAIFIHLRARSLHVFDADISKCFDEIDHEKLLDKLDTLPIIHDQVSAWLKAGVVDIRFGDNKTDIGTVSNEKGTPQGGVISPLLANIALHGLETAVKEYYASNLYSGSKRLGKRDITRRVAIIRYADDFVVLHEDVGVVHSLRAYIDKWLFQEIGLRISEEKSQIVSTFNGFNFLGFRITSVRKSPTRIKCLISVSKESKKKFLDKTRNIIQNNKSASAGGLIVLLNPVIVGWCNYFRYAECVKDFKQVEYALFGQLRAWVFRRRSKGLRSREKIKEKYFPANSTVVFRGKTHSGSWILKGTVLGRGAQKKEVHLVYPGWVNSTVWKKVKGDSSPYDGNHVYWAVHNMAYSGIGHTTARLIKRQRSICPLCKAHFKEGDIIQKDHIIPVALGGKNNYQNLQAAHDYCHHTKSKLELKFTRPATKTTTKPSSKENL